MSTGDTRRAGTGLGGDRVVPRPAGPGVTGTSTGALVHEALLYRDDDEYLAVTVPFVRSAVASGEPVLAAVPGGRADLLRDAIGEPPAGVRIVDMSEAGRNPGRIIPWVLHAFISEHSGGRVSIIGEPIWAERTGDEYPACVQHEALINKALGDRAATILCPYDASRLTPGALTDAARTHPTLIIGRDDRHASPGYDPDGVVGDYNLVLTEPPSHAVGLTFDAPRLPLVRDIVVGCGERLGLAANRVLDLELAANELATNAVTHGPGTGTVLLWPEEGYLVCEVRDRGRARQPLTGRVPPPPETLGGRGLVLVNYLSDLVRVHTGPDGTAVRLYMLLG